MRGFMILGLFALCCGASASAQTSYSALASREDARGILMNRDVMSVAEMGQYGWSTFQYGTARSMAMAGAMTSLGGDASSMMINPAGLGMYRDGEVVITPFINIQQSDTKGGAKYGDSSTTSAGLSNFATVFNVYESGTSKLISLNVGLGYNRINDFNYKYSLQNSGSSSSIANLFSRQLTGLGVGLNELYGNEKPNWNTLNTSAWGAGLGYKTGLTFQSYGEIPSGYYDTDPEATAAQNYRETITDAAEPVWSSTWMNSDTQVTHYMEVESEGSVGEYDIAVGGNIQNKIYFGFTLGIQSLYQRLDLLYGEEYTNPANSALDNELLYMNYNQTIITQGVGVNMKMGLTYRPIEPLRVAIAYHTPTWYSLDREYQISMASASTFSSDADNIYYAAANSPILEDFGENRWRFNSPSRLLVGASYILWQRALLSVDYQCDWYGGMKVRKLPYGVDESLYSSFGECFDTLHTLRIGAEAKVTPALALRGGYGFSSSLVGDNFSSAELLDISTTDRVEYFSAGVGYSPAQMVRFDLTYMNQQSHMTDYTLFYGVGDSSNSAIPSAASSQSGSYSTKLKSHYISLSMVIRL